MILAIIASLALAAVGINAAEALGNTSFDAQDGNLIVEGVESDWASPPSNIWVQDDEETGQDDNSFGQGTAENTAVPSVVSGGIPNNKSDLSRFYVANDKQNGKDFLYLAWARVQDPTGTTNMDFEFNQSRTASGNLVTPVRTAGDVLIKYDLSNGGTTVTMGYHRWIASKAAGLCEAGNKYPCWDQVHPIGTTNFEATVNTADADDLQGGVYGIRTFGEAAVNLTDSEILPASSCTTFGSAYLKSRSSDSFTAALKDFIAPQNITISNCGTVDVDKEDEEGNPIANVGFTLYPNNAPLAAPRGSEDIWPATVTAPTCTTGTNGNCTTPFSGLAFGNYWMVESGPPSGYTPSEDVAFNLSATNSPLTVTVVNTRRPATVTVKKVDDSATPIGLQGATFTLFQDNAPTGTYNTDGATPDTASDYSCTTASTGLCTISEILDPGAYWIVETVAPLGYAATSTPVLRNIELGGTYGTTAAPITFSNARQYKVIVLVCQDGSPDGLGTDSLKASTVTFGNDTAGAKTTLSASGTPSVEQLCSLGGANFAPKPAGTHSLSVAIP